MDPNAAWSFATDAEAEVVNSAAGQEYGGRTIEDHAIIFPALSDVVVVEGSPAELLAWTDHIRDQLTAGSPYEFSIDDLRTLAQIGAGAAVSGSYAQALTAFRKPDEAHALAVEAAQRMYGVAPETIGERPGVTIEITREQLEAWAGRTLTDQEVFVMDNLIPNSGLPETIAALADSLGRG